MRKGDNPAKLGTQAYQPEQLAIAILVYIPTLEGYFEESLDILKLQIESIHRSTPATFDLWVFDNGSCEQVQAELHRCHEQGCIDFLVSSRHNLGKTGALNWIFSALPNELICYTDGDVLFRPGWLEASLKIMQSFLKPGMVAAQPSLFDVLQGSGQAHLSLLDSSDFSIEKVFLDPKVVDEFAYSVGLSEERTEQMKQTPVSLATCHKESVQAVIGATHMQFIIPRALARQVTPLPATLGLSKEQDVWLDTKVDQLGYLHLSTPQAYVYHMGNTIDERLLGEVRAAGLMAGGLLEPTKRTGSGSWQMRMLSTLSKNSRFHNWLRRLYKLLFEFFAQ